MTSATALPVSTTATPINWSLANQPASPAIPPSSVNVRTPPNRACNPVAWPGPLPFDTDGAAADRGDDDSHQPEVVAHLRIACLLNRYLATE